MFSNVPPPGSESHIRFSQIFEDMNRAEEEIRYFFNSRLDLPIQPGYVYDFVPVEDSDPEEDGRVILSTYSPESSIDPESSTDSGIGSGSDVSGQSPSNSSSYSPTTTTDTLPCVELVDVLNALSSGNVDYDYLDDHLSVSSDSFNPDYLLSLNDEDFDELTGSS